MRNIPFVKYTSCGNTFVILDESTTEFFTEQEKSAFAYHATNSNFGVGSDNFIVIQPCRSPILDRVRRYRRYWPHVPISNEMDYVFRMFEPDGTEAYSCANGLMSCMQHIYKTYQKTSATFMTEIPAPVPGRVKSGINPINRKTWVNLGSPRRVPDVLAASGIKKPFEGTFDRMREQTIRFRKPDLNPWYYKESIPLTGYLIFTGEPHLVIIVGENFPIKSLSDLLFIPPHFCSPAESMKTEKRFEFGTWLVQHIGHYFNCKLRHHFPKGINVNFVRVNRRRKAVEYRCFERGINKETLSCGTGGLASAYVASRLGYIQQDTIPVLPYRCRCYDSDAQLIIRKVKNEWVMEGDPRLIFRGESMVMDECLDTPLPRRLISQSSPVYSRAG